MLTNELIPRDMWQRSVRPEIRKWLVENDPEQKIRCLLTVWGVPLKISPAQADDHSRKYQRFLEDEHAHRLKLLGIVRQSLDQISPQGQISTELKQDLDGTAVEIPTESIGGLQKDSSSAAAATNTSAPGDDPDPAAGPAITTESQAGESETLQAMRGQLEKALQSAQVRIAKLGVGDTRNRAQLQLQQMAAVPAARESSCRD